MNDLSAPSRITYGAVPVRPAVVRRIRGLSDKALAWLFITPTMVLLLAINIFPLVWTIYLSFTNYRANRANAPSIFGAPHFQPEITILQRERTPDTPGWLSIAGCLIVLACTLALIAGLTWGAGRINNSETPIDTEAEDRPTVQA